MGGWQDFIVFALVLACVGYLVQRSWRAVLGRGQAGCGGCAGCPKTTELPGLVEKPFVPLSDLKLAPRPR